MDPARVRDEIRNGEDSPSVKDLDRADAIGSVGAGGDDPAADALGHAGCDRVGPRTRHEHVAVELEERLAWEYRARAVLDEPIAVTLTERDELLDVEPVRIREETVDGAHPHYPGP